MYQEAQVRNGIALLDERKPGWRERFDPPNLNMASMFQCTLGQVYGTYGTGVEALDLGVGDAADYGFTTPVTPVRSMDEVYTEFAELGKTWRALVTA